MGSNSPRVNSFKERLAYSLRPEDEAGWLNHYRTKWPHLLRIEVVTDRALQRKGIDRRVHMPDGQVYTIDEKKRETNYNDILLEEWSVWHGSPNAPGNKIGWALDPSKICDYIAYRILDPRTNPPTDKAYFFSAPTLRKVFRDNLRRWKHEGKYPIDARNDGYKTRNCAVSVSKLQRAIIDEQNSALYDRQICLFGGSHATT